MKIGKWQILDVRWLLVNRLINFLNLDIKIKI